MGTSKQENPTGAGAIAGGIVALLVVLAAFWLVGGNQSAFGASSDSGWNATGDGCISVDGTCIIDASGNLDGAVTSTNGTFSGTLSVTGTTTVDHIIEGAGITASSTSANGTIQSTNWDIETTFSVTPTVGAITVTTNTSSTPPFSLLSAGQRIYRCVENATTTSGIAVTVAGGTGVNANVASSSNLVLGATARLCGWAHKATDTDIEWDVTKYGE